MPPTKRRGNVAKTSGAMKYVQEPRKPNKRGSLSLAASGSSGDVRGASSYSVRDATEDDAEAISALCVRTSALHSLLAALDADMRRWVLQREFRDAEEPDMDDLIARMAPVDLILIEGFKRHRHAKLEVFRASVGKSLLAAEDDTIVAVASDASVDGVTCPVLDMNDVRAVADFIVTHCGLAVSPQTDKMSHGAA